MDIQHSRGLVLNVPDFFADPGFRAWLDADRPKFTWHRGGTPAEWSDVIVLVDPSLNGEGTDSDMPDALWEKIVAACREHLGSARNSETHYVVRLTNLTP
jgi:hypothetical protein